jgi:hypothetical protein
LVEELERSEALIPLSNALIFGVDEQRHTADLGGHPEASATGRQKKLPSEAASLNRTIHGQPRKPEDRHFMTRQAALDQKRRTVINHGSRRKAVETENRKVIVSNGEKRFACATFMVLACMMAQKRIQDRLSAVKDVAVMGVGNRFFMPGDEGHGASGRA